MGWLRLLLHCYYGYLLFQYMERESGTRPLRGHSADLYMPVTCLPYAFIIDIFFKRLDLSTICRIWWGYLPVE